VPHELAGAFKQAIGIGKLGTTKKTDIDVRCEGIGVSECRVPDTRGRMTVVQYFSDIVSAGAHHLKPALRDCSQFIIMLAHPRFDAKVSVNRTGKSHELAHHMLFEVLISDLFYPVITQQQGCWFCLTRRETEGANAKMRNRPLYDIPLAMMIPSDVIDKSTAQA
jgi:hypothetical protein